MISYLVEINTGVDAQVHVFQDSLGCGDAIRAAANDVIFFIHEVDRGWRCKIQNQNQNQNCKPHFSDFSDTKLFLMDIEG